VLFLLKRATGSIAGALADGAIDLIAKVPSPASRAGSVAERAGRMLEGGVDPDVIALQMTKNSPTGKRYTADKVQAYGGLYEDSKTKAALTVKQILIFAHGVGTVP
jgi:delta 1-pyrroline-5-carboxylate dehydrogenase